MIERDIQNFAPGAYAQAAPVLLGDPHAALLEILESFLGPRESPVLLVLGSGAEVLPYACEYVDGRLEGSGRDRVKRMLGGGRMILVDVRDDEVSGLAKGAQTLERCGFFEPGYFRKVLPGDADVPFAADMPVNPADYPPGSIVFLQQNFRDPLWVVPGSVDAVDATLCLHHITQTRAHLAAACASVFQALAPGGLLHMGEGSVDMGTTEDKMLRLGRDLSDICGSVVQILDQRDPSRWNQLPIGMGESPDLGYLLRISPEGLALVEAGRSGCPIADGEMPRAIGEGLKARGYVQMLILSDSLVLPLVDSSMPGDQHHLREVNRFYDAAIARIVDGYRGKNDDLVRTMTGALSQERGNALRGVVEYYQSERTCRDALLSAGFRDISVVHHDSVPVYNLTARKPGGASLSLEPSSYRANFHSAGSPYPGIRVAPGGSGTTGMRARSAKPVPSRVYSGWRPVNGSSGTALK